MDRLSIKKLKADKRVVPSSKLFLKVKYLLAGGGHRQKHDDYESTSLPAVATSSVPMVAARSANRGNARMSTDVPSAYPHGHMRSAMQMVNYLLDRAVTMLIAESHRRWSQRVL
jgi:hypothetical protein